MKKHKSKYKSDKEKIYLLILGSKNPPILQKLKCWIINIGIHCVTVLRLGQFAYKLFKRNKVIGIFPFVIFYILNFWIKVIHHVDISYKSEIGPGFYASHSQDIWIGAVKMGSNCTIHHNVTIGMDPTQNEYKVPSIGNNVWIGPGAIISGDIKIGDDTVISAGTILSKDIPERCLVAGNPGRIITRDYDNSNIVTMPELKIDKKEK